MKMDPSTGYGCSIASHGGENMRPSIEPATLVSTTLDVSKRAPPTLSLTSSPGADGALAPSAAADPSAAAPRSAAPPRSAAGAGG
jgi:hypothetical protein